MALTRRDQDIVSIALRAAPPAGSPYSLPIPGSQREGRTSVYRHWRFVDEPLLQTIDPEILTAHDSFEASMKKRPSARCLGSRPWDPVTKRFGKYDWMTYGETSLRRKNFGAGIVELHKEAGVTEEKYGVGLWCQNRPEWQISDLGCMSQSLFTVSLYNTLGPETTEYIINHATLVCVITSLKHIPTLLKLAPRVPTLKLIICLDPLDAGERPGNSKAEILNALAADAGLSIHSIDYVEALGAASNLQMKPPKPDDIITINYKYASIITLLIVQQGGVQYCSFETRSRLNSTRHTYRLLFTGSSEPRHQHQAQTVDFIFVGGSAGSANTAYNTCTYVGGW